jgi:hypothetical protein
MGNLDIFIHSQWLGGNSPLKGGGACDVLYPSAPLVLAYVWVVCLVTEFGLGPYNRTEP